MAQIILISYEEIDKKTKKKTGRVLVSHGIDVDTFENIVLPSEPINEIGRWDKYLDEWVLR
ncbi:hypothetical protein NV379_01790 [Paenibacillus sp. N1-5-1-14]|uniref:hypothetical protein n=1 Tax=Paenibacillus radicibacter TaxID=2972488 RepID=UPI002159A660|nr:hypothetical protein [Paenibacillus radicibacter]MCR8641377.1 hypothetical protein [Paenibacillus radicibacter]